MHQEQAANNQNCKSKRCKDQALTLTHKEGQHHREHPPDNDYIGPEIGQGCLVPEIEGSQSEGAGQVKNQTDGNHKTKQRIPTDQHRHLANDRSEVPGRWQALQAYYRRRDSC